MSGIAENNTFQGDGWHFDYISFGKGDRPMLLLPGVGDGFRTAKGLALPFSLLYRTFARDFRVYVLSRREPLPKLWSTGDMAKDIACWMEAEGLEHADVVGVSQGGMIAQWLALLYPQRVRKLVLAVTAASPTPVMEQAISNWIRLARQRKFSAIMEDTARRSYTGAYQRQGILQSRLIGKLMPPKEYERFLTLCHSCLTHNVSDRLCEITAPTLVLGGERDQVVGAQASLELARSIPHAKLHLYPGQSHGVYEQEMTDFNRRIKRFLLNP